MAQIDDYGRKGKDQVNYRRYEKCLTCDHFFPSGVCELVDGNISPDSVCDLWEVKSERPRYKDKEYFEKEFERSRGE